jgi:nucleoside-diphosphate-sugar epimerase
MMVYVIGARGRLGQAIVQAYENTQTVALARSVYQDWCQPNIPDAVSRFFERHVSDAATIFVASGLLDPRLPAEELLTVNYYLPKNVIEGATKLGIKVITFGTVMETLLPSKNLYIQSKMRLSQYVKQRTTQGRRALHVQLHTLFGIGEPVPFMFLGQMLAAIRTHQPFNMTSGRQLREYHHLRDEALAISRIAASDAEGVLNLSHGKPLSLRTIAEQVFQSLGKSPLLRVGALPEPPDENYEKVLSPVDILPSMVFRDSLPAIIGYMRNCYHDQVDQV